MKNKELFNNTVIPIPPLEEQQEIVDIVNGYMDDIDALTQLIL